MMRTATQRLFVFALALGLAACTLGKQNAPAPTGPSSYALSLDISASPDHLTQNGASSVRLVTRWPMVGLETILDVYLDWILPKLYQAGVEMFVAHLRHKTNARFISAYALWTPRSSSWSIVEPCAHARVEDNLNPAGRVFYGASTSADRPRWRAYISRAHSLTPLESSTSRTGASRGWLRWGCG